MSVFRRGASHVARPFINGRHVYLGSWSEKKYGADAKRLAQEAHDSLTKRAGLAGRELVGDFAKRWVADYPRPKVSTNETNRQRASQIAADNDPLRVDARLVILPRLRLNEVTRPIARAYIRRNPSLLPTLRALFNDAREDELVDANPFAKLGRRQSQGRKNVAPLTESELHALAECSLDALGETYGYVFASLIRFAGYTGLRESELFGLEWADIDFQRAEVKVRRRMYRGEVDSPKNGLIRTVVLPPPAAEALRAMPRYARPVKLNGEPFDAIFRTKQGKPFVSNSTLYWSWDKVRTLFETRLDPARRRQLAEHRPVRKGVTERRLEAHELRHFCGHHLYVTLGLPAEVVAQQLGHTDHGLLVKSLYGHPEASRQRDEIRAAFQQNVRVLKSVADSASAEVGKG